jgi:hypothetical protein
LPPLPITHDHKKKRKRGEYNETDHEVHEISPPGHDLL